jgi:adenosylmethionine-8-amino-7-oxononanoate aminotransferase
MQAALADDVLTVPELLSLSSLRIGSANFFKETQHPGNERPQGPGNGKIEMTAHGTLTDGRTFQFQVRDRHGLVLVFDEIATGFGRTGTMFAADAARVAPDIMCVGKALTGGYLTLAAVLCTRQIAHGLSHSESGVLMHGPTYMGNPLACAVALASLDLLEADDWSTQVTRVNAALESGLAAARRLPGVSDVRTIGAVGVVQLDHPVDVGKATEAAVEQGVWLRPFRDLIYTMPPYVATDEEVARICAAIEAAAVVA